MGYYKNTAWNLKVLKKSKNFRQKICFPWKWTFFFGCFFFLSPIGFSHLPLSWEQMFGLLLVDVAIGFSGLSLSVHAPGLHLLLHLLELRSRFRIANAGLVPWRAGSASASAAVGCSIVVVHLGSLSTPVNESRKNETFNFCGMRKVHICLQQYCDLLI